VSTAIDITRLIRIGALALSVLAVALVYLAYTPTIETLHARIDDGQNELRSDEIALSQVPSLRAERTQLGERYASLFAQNPEAVFVRELATTVHRHHVALLATSVAQDSAPLASDGPTLPFIRTRVSIEIRGTYRALLATISDLSTGSEIVEVLESSLRRDGPVVIASIPAIIYEPQRATQQNIVRNGATP
jgi:Tfp pilus assembly protein PilO